MVNWIEKYRLDPDWFQTDKDKKNIFLFISNHDIEHAILENRNAKLSSVLNFDHIDTLEYLNPILDIFYQKITQTFETPNMVSILYSKETGGNVKKFLCTSSTTHQNTDGLFSWVNNIYVDNYFYPYKIDIDNTSGRINLRSGILPKELYSLI